jgi:hypothetical protein
MLETNQDKINWSHLSSNPNAMKLLMANQDKINWYQLSLNPSAIDLLQENTDKIDWISFSVNPAIFELDYEAMKIANEGMYEELIKEVMKPSRVFKNPDYDYLEELFGE